MSSIRLVDDLFSFDVNQRERDILWRGAAQELAHQASHLDRLSYRHELGQDAAGACRVIRVVAPMLDCLGWDQEQDPRDTYRVVVSLIEFRTVLEGWRRAIDNTLDRGAEDWVVIDDALDARALVNRLLEQLAGAVSEAA